MKNRICLSLISISLLSTIILSGCVSKAPREVFHTVDMENRGEEVYEFQIHYGVVPLPFRSGPDPEFGAGGGRAHLDDMVVPDIAKVHWKTKDGVTYCPAVQIRSHVTKPNEFSGNVEFNIKNNELQVFVFEKVQMKLEREKMKPVYTGTEKCFMK